MWLVLSRHVARNPVFLSGAGSRTDHRPPGMWERGEIVRCCASVDLRGAIALASP